MERTICRQVISDLAGREVSAQEARDLLDEIERRAARLREEDATLSFNDALSQAGKDFATGAEFRALAKKRNTFLNARRTFEAVDYLRTTWADDPATGLKALLVGVQKQRRGARLSAGTEIDTLRNSYLGGLLADVEAATDGGIELLTSGAMDTEIARALWQINSKEPAFGGLDSRAVNIAHAVAKWQDVARTDANRAGAFIGKVEGYIVRQSHDPVRIAADRDGWMAMARDTFDLGRMLGDHQADDVDRMLDALWRDLADGVHLKVEQPAPDLPKRLRGMATGLSHERIVHFRGPEAWLRYNRDFGGGNLREALVHGLERAARATGLMRVFGPNHEMVYDDIVRQTLAHMKVDGASPTSIRNFRDKARRYSDWYLKDLDGTLAIPGNNTLASHAAAVRAVQTMASLGSSTLSSLADLGVMMRGATANGGNAFDIVGRGIGKLFEGVPDAERLQLLADLGMAFDSLTGKLAAGRFSLDDGARGLWSGLQQKFFTLNLQNRWTDAMRQASAEFLSANLARRATLTWDALPTDLQGTLALYGLDSARWDIVRTGARREQAGQAFITPSALDEVPDAAFAALVDARGAPVTPHAIAEARRDLARQLRAYFNDQKSYLLLTPDAGTSGLLKMGTSRGTAAGEGVRFIMQFKSYSVAFSQKIIGRELQQHGLVGVAKLIAITTLFGYLSSALKDVARGMVPRDPEDPRTWVASLQQGGGAGIYGDVLFSQVFERRYQDAGLSLLGPTAGDVLGAQGLAGLLGRTSDWLAGNDHADPAAAGVRFIKSNTPFLNLFYTRLALDYLVFWQLQETLNPGSLDRMQQRLQQETGREFLIAPSTH